MQFAHANTESQIKTYIQATNWDTSYATDFYDCKFEMDTINININDGVDPAITATDFVNYCTDYEGLVL